MISLVRATGHIDSQVISISAKGNAQPDIKAVDNGFRLTAPAGSSGGSLVSFWMRNPDGASREVSLPVIVEALPTVSFTYKPKGKAPNSVHLAGDFNGWNASKDPFTKQPDGSFSLSMPMRPGQMKYKFVVDGDWISDPSNPKTDDSGYGNSLLEVEGDAVEEFQFGFLGANMPGSGPQGALRGKLEKGEKLLSTHIWLLVNNTLASPEWYTVDEAEGIIRLNVPDGMWMADNTVTVVARTDKNRLGCWSVPVAYAAAPRSPKDDILYFAMTDRFLDGNKALNTHPGGENLTTGVTYHGGDWDGITKKIDEGYFDNLGATVIWISPVTKNTPKVHKESVPPGRFYTAYHGYWPISSTETNEQFGSMEDLKKLVATAHKHDMAVLFDMVSNHLHEDHPLLQEHPEYIVPLKTPDGRDNIRMFDEFPYTTWFDTFLPDLDYANQPRLVTTMADNSIWWLQQTGADGLRQDAVKHIPEVFWRELTAKLNKQYLEDRGQMVYQVGETISGHSTISQFIGPDMMNGQFDFPTYFSMREAIAKGQGTMSDLGEAVLRARDLYPPGSIMSPLIGNHDFSRFTAFADGDIPDGADDREIGFENPPKVDNLDTYAKLQFAFAFLMSLPGAPMIYYGDEIGLSGAADPDNRRDMQWQDLAPQQTETRDIVSRLAKARHDSVALRRGTIEVVHSEAERLLLARISPEETVLIALARKPADDSLTMVWPAPWGTPTTLTPLANGGIQATISDNRLRLEDGKFGDYKWGVWKVQW